MTNFTRLIPFFILFFSFIQFTISQSLPLEMNLTSDGRLVSGTNEVEGLYDLNNVHKIELTFTETNWFTIMDGSGQGPNAIPGSSLIATMTFNDTEVFENVEVNIKGATSDFQNNSEKKSFSIDLDAVENHDLMGYDNLNLNCGFQDESSMREVLYYNHSRGFAPALKAAFVDLYINGEYWGPYSNVQQIEGTYISEWFGDNDGTRWRALDPNWTGGGGGPGGGGGGGGPGGGGGGMFGLGESTLNYNGPDSTDYNENYTLKNTDVEDPWAALINACDQLNNLPTDQLYDELKYHIDVDRALWVLAQESVFMDDDSYINKGGMDYYVYWHKATNRLMPLEVDGNTVMPAGSTAWSPFRNAEDPDYALMNRLFSNNDLRQRYLAHIRTILKNHFVPSEMHAKMDEFVQILDQRVQDDTKKIYSYNQFTNGVEDLKSFIDDRYTYLSEFSEIDRPQLTIQDMFFTSSNGDFEGPNNGEELDVSIQITDDASIGIDQVRLYYAPAFEGAFEYTTMTDSDGDGTYQGNIPSFPASSYVRFYFEAIAADANNTASFFPEGAEHDVFIYQVESAINISDDLVINELMASNDETVSDEAGEFDDWIELYNNTNATINLEGYFLSDDENNLLKWPIPNGTTIAANDYLMVWADDDDEQGAFHANFKLSSNGETLFLINANGEIINQVEFDEQGTDLAYARIPNGTGDFIIKSPTFGVFNESTVSVKDIEEKQFSIRPNPTADFLQIIMDASYSGKELILYDALGNIVLQRTINTQDYIDVSKLAQGFYLIQIDDLRPQRFVIVR